MRREKMSKHMEFLKSDPTVATVKAKSIQTPRQLLALFKLCGPDFWLNQNQVDELIELGFEHLLEYTEKK